MGHRLAMGRETNLVRLSSEGGGATISRNFDGSYAMTPRQRQLCEMAEVQRRRCRDWLLNFIVSGQPRAFTKKELRASAVRGLGVPKNAFDFAWIDAIETTGRYDWYNPLPRNPKAAN